MNDFLASDAGQASLANTNKLVLKTDAANIDAVTAALKLTDGERKFLLSAKKGEGLYFLGQAHVPIRVVASKREYDLANTNVQELCLQEMKGTVNEVANVHELEAARLEKSYLVPIDGTEGVTQ